MILNHQKSGKDFGPGPWQDEPGRVEWRYKNHPCLAIRNSLGAWCGYTAINPSHRLFGKDYDDIPVEVHGGVTYARFCDGQEGIGICHKPRPGEPADVYWIGFDCCHANDLYPDNFYIGASTVYYRTLKYVRAQIESLADQLEALNQ